ncbi:MAG: hypothetical protein AAGL24_29140 [Pseudomonadota bacterium]
MFFRLFLDPRFLLALMIAPFIAGSGELMVTNMMADRIFAFHPWTMASLVWPHGGGRGDTLVPVWLMPGLAFTYIATYVCGLPVMMFLFRRRTLSPGRFVIAGAATAFCYKTLIIIAYLSYLAATNDDVRTVLFGIPSLWKWIEWLWPMIISTTLYGFLVGLIFWVVAVWKNPDLPARDGSSSHLASRTQ